MSRSTPAVLVIAATDSSGGAGLVRDIETLAHFHTPARCAVTAVTAQSNALVYVTHVVPAELVQAQIRAAFEDGPIGAIKIGMLATADIVQAIAESLPPRDQIAIVLDPVLSSSSGAALLDLPGRALLRQRLLPKVTLLTPNIPEAAVLLGEPVAADPVVRAAQLQRLLALGPQAVLLKGGHDAQQEGASVIDWLARAAQQPVDLAVPRIRAERRGSGCSLASAIAAQLASGLPLEAACRSAQAYVGELFRQAAAA